MIDHARNWIRFEQTGIVPWKNSREWKRHKPDEKFLEEVRKDFPNG